MKIIRGISGVRGIVGETLTSEISNFYVGAFSQVQGRGKILLARDSRTLGGNLINAAQDALIKVGRDVVNCEIIPTPTAQFLVEKYKMAGGIVLTASHNPPKWNGLKFIDADGCFLNAQQNQKIFQIVDRNNLVTADTAGKSQKFPQGLTDHIEHTCNLRAIDITKIKSRKFKIVVDAVNGAAYSALPELFSALNCDVFPIHCTPDGKFPRGAEPLPHNLSDLSAKVREVHADVGFATDPDGDRLAVVDENGDPLGEEYTLTICADGFLSDQNQSAVLVTNLSTTMALDKIAEKYGAAIKRSAVGEINVVNVMKDCGSPLGGEGNGGVILPESHYGRDSLVGAAMFLNRMAQTGKPVSQIKASMPQFVMVKDKVQLTDIDPDDVIKKISVKYKDVQQNKLDGLKLVWSDRWVHIRKSNTEPIVRIYAEAPSEKEVTGLVKDIKQSMI